MKSIIIAPDSFKGTLDAREICSIVSRVIMEHMPDAEIISIPMADGGEGFVDSYLNVLKGHREKSVVTGPHGRNVTSEYAVLESGTAVMEMAACAGLPLMQGKLDPMHATTYGVGELLTHAAASGIREVLIGVGGSATNDMGVGMAAALGYQFLDKEFRVLEPFACNIGSIEHIRKPDKKLNLHITVACDVNNPLYGPNGATYTFGKQKGVTEEAMKILDRAAEHFSDVICRELGIDIGLLPGAGAGGGIGGALVAFLNAELKPGIEIFLDTIQFDELLHSCDLVITGEGKIDWQSMAGKVPVGIAKRAARAGVPCVALCGSVGYNAEMAYNAGMSAIFSSVKDFANGELEKAGYEENIRFLADSVMRILMIGEGEKIG